MTGDGISLQAPASNAPYLQQSAQQQSGSSSQGAGSQQAQQAEQAAEQAGTVAGVQNLQTKGDGEETVQPAGVRVQSYGNLSQEVLLCLAAELFMLLIWSRINLSLHKCGQLVCVAGVCILNVHR